MDKNSVWAWAVKNSVCVICWSAIAIFFGKWWIALFSILFISDFTTISKHYRVCDNCGKHSSLANSREEALEKAKAAGWTHIDSNNTDYCRDCSKT